MAQPNNLNLKTFDISKFLKMTWNSSPVKFSFNYAASYAAIDMSIDTYKKY